MLKKIAKKLQVVTGVCHTVDPSRFRDPLAMETEWTPAVSGGASFGTHKLVKVGSDRMEFRATGGARLFSFAFILIGAGVMIGFLVAGMSTGGMAFNPGAILPAGLGLVFICLGVYLLHQGTIPIVFDRRLGFFWKGREAPNEVVDWKNIKCCAKMDNIHALQLIFEYCRGNKSSYYSYELNLVLKDGRRINVVDHGNRNRLKEDAAMLSGFLEKPVWDAITV